LLWVGGLPFLVAYFWFVSRALRRCWEIARRRSDPTAIACVALVCALASNVIVMLFDPHLTYRRTADVLFVLLALGRPLVTRAQTASARPAQPTSFAAKPDALVQ